MKKAFTLIELVVAVSLLAMVFLFAGTIFRVSIDSYRTSVANAEIMQKLRAITDQLNTDFAGLQTDAPLLFWFEQDDPNRYDQIMFFANGDFQSIQLYNTSVPDPEGSEIVQGSTARIFYGQAYSLDSRDNTMRNPDMLLEEDRLLARRRHILTTNFAMWPDPNDQTLADFGAIDGDGYKKNERYEHDRLSLAQWKIIDGDVYDNAGSVIDTCFANRPVVDMDDPNTFHKLMCEGIGSFAIQWAYWDFGELNWYPESSDFAANLGVYFNVPGSITDWTDGLTVADNVYPKALKFTFRLYDSKGIIKEDGRAGRTFTHIVYLGD